MARKTIDVSDMLAEANRLLTLPYDGTHVTVGFKQGVCAMIERILHDTGNYAGYLYVKPQMIRLGEWGTKGNRVESNPFVSGDDMTPEIDYTRNYYTSSHLFARR